MIINNNIPALNTYRQMGINQNAGQSAMEKLSSGLRINRAGDDAAGLAISEKMRGQIRGLNQASRNAQDSISLIQTAEGALQETQSILQRMRELAVQSANDTNTEADREEIQKEINELVDEIDRIANTTEFNTMKLLDGSRKGFSDTRDASFEVQRNTHADVTVEAVSGFGEAATDDAVVTITYIGADESGNAQFAIDSSIELGSGALTTASGSSTLEIASGAELTINGLENMKEGESITISVRGYDAGNNGEDAVSNSLSMQIGANTGQNMLIGINDMRAQALNVRDDAGNAIDVTDATKASQAITTINNAIESVSAQRSNLGAFQNRLEHTISNLDNSAENLQAAESRIRDVDMAREMMEYTRANILSQASQAMLAQANQAPQSVLQLLG
ncbi:flagellin [Alkalihalobacillus oceani]|uniref:flagellin N-terminal helical domain-containing protein n=1 Tax=Halalkalibacter oceani TaxID=1653776 RepID=UPI00203C852D|nr:flagellin [Halalkalibacter oceani]MCM3760907.1 flagellin [Halalkalibacter oceani]